jgi:hypothetical protein
MIPAEFDVARPGETQPTRVPRSAPTAWLAVAQAALSALAALLLWAFGAGMGIFGLMDAASTGALRDSLPLLLMAAGLIFSGVLLLPSFGLALRQLRASGQAARPARIRRSWPFSVLALILPLVLLLGGWAATTASPGWLLLPPMHVLAVGLPVLWLTVITVRGLPLGSAQRAWGVFGAGLVLGPVIIFTLELLALIVSGVLAVVVISLQPDLVRELTAVFERFTVGQPYPQEVLTALQPYLTRPAVIAGVLGFVAVLVPLVEEIFKPIGVWLLVRRRLSPMEGFAAGALSGAGYALFESLALSASAEEWALLVTARMGTGAIHIFTSALMGWALARAWRRGSYGRLGWAYLLAVAIHGLWNGVTLLAAFAGLLGGSGTPAPLWLQPFTLGGGLVLIWLAGGALVGLLLANRSWRGRLASQTFQQE